MGGPPPQPNVAFFACLMVSKVTLDVILHQGARLKVGVSESSKQAPRPTLTPEPVAAHAAWSAAEGVQWVLNSDPSHHHRRVLDETAAALCNR